MAKKCQSEHTAQRHAALQQSLLALLHNQSFQDISVKDICQHAAIPRRTFYHYFNGKEDLMDALISDLVLACDLASMPDFSADTQDIHQSFERFFQFWGETHSDTLAMLLRNGQGQRIIHFAVIWFQREAQKVNGWSQKEVDQQKMVVLATTTGVFSLLFYWMSNGCRENITQMADYAIRFLTEPLLS